MIHMNEHIIWQIFYIGLYLSELWALSCYLETMNLSALTGILSAPPTAELEPLKDGRLAQTDEQVGEQTLLLN